METREPLAPPQELYLTPLFLTSVHMSVAFPYGFTPGAVDRYEDTGSRALDLLASRLLPKSAGKLLRDARNTKQQFSDMSAFTPQKKKRAYHHLASSSASSSLVLPTSRQELKDARQDADLGDLRKKVNVMAKKLKANSAYKDALALIAYDNAKAASGWHFDASLSQISTGNTEGTRNGNEIHMKSLQFKASLERNGVSYTYRNIYRLLFIWDMYDREANPTVQYGDYFENNSINSAFVKGHGGKFKVLYDREWVIDGDIQRADAAKLIQLKKVIGKKGSYWGSSPSNIAKGMLVIAICATDPGASSQLDLRYYSRIGFTV